ncbi:unnamed protein product, partial [Mesorhabditis belari]|uniref:Uncharacterized protein n=1 Tax=Mesorhabditis belari TaxID=2138241 RepID=A0AAF3FIY5_9BILA
MKNFFALAAVFICFSFAQSDVRPPLTCDMYRTIHVNLIKTAVKLGKDGVDEGKLHEYLKEICEKKTIQSDSCEAIYKDFESKFLEVIRGVKEGKSGVEMHREVPHCQKDESSTEDD